jgi:hypothetical protein
MVPHSWAFGKVMPRGLALKGLSHHCADLQSLHELSRYGLGGGSEQAQVKTVRWRLFQTAGKVVHYGWQMFLNICGVALEIFAAVREH